MLTRVAIVLALLALLVAGCGGDEDEPSAETLPVPELTVPGEEAPAAETTEEPATTEETSPPPTETTAPEEPSGGSEAPAQTTEDSPENDTPPPADSPAAKFEKFCEDNPGAC